MKQLSHVFFYLTALTALLCVAQLSYAQETPQGGNTTIMEADTIELNDQTLLVNTQGDTIVITSEENERIIPRKAALFSAALPGLGQAYNGSYWKIPIIYGAFITLGYITVYSNDLYQSFRRAYIAQVNGFPELNPYSDTVFGGNERTLNNNVENLRRERDRTYIFFAGAYALQIMEAIVDAHLIEFDISEDLALQMQPSAGQVMYSAHAASFTPAMGGSLILKIK
jgi:hypothetical protein